MSVSNASLSVISGQSRARMPRRGGQSSRRTANKRRWLFSSPKCSASRERSGLDCIQAHELSQGLIWCAGVNALAPDEPSSVTGREGVIDGCHTAEEGARWCGSMRHEAQPNGVGAHTQELELARAYCALIWPMLAIGPAGRQVRSDVPATMRNRRPPTPLASGVCACVMDCTSMSQTLQ